MNHFTETLLLCAIMLWAGEHVDAAVQAKRPIDVFAYGVLTAGALVGLLIRAVGGGS